MKRVGPIILGSLAALASVVVVASSALFEGADQCRFDTPRPVAFDTPESAAAFPHSSQVTTD